MTHLAELTALLLLMSIGHGVTVSAPEVVRRIVRNFILWMIAFGVGLALFSLSWLVTAVVRFGAVFAVAYAVRWVVGDVVDFLRGPYLMAIPGPAGIAEAVRRISGKSARESRRLTDCVCDENDPVIALLGLVFVGSEGGEKAQDFGAAWRKGCDGALASVSELVEKHGVSRGKGRRAVFDMRFIAEALCVYDPKIVVRVLDGMKAPALGSRRARSQVMRQLKRVGRRTSLTVKLGLESPQGADGAGMEGRDFRIWMVALPALGLSRAGFSRRATALGISLLLLFGYGVFALTIGRASGWVYLAVGVLVHIEALFALGDFAPSLNLLRRKSSFRGRQS